MQHCPQRAHTAMVLAFCLFFATGCVLDGKTDYNERDDLACRARMESEIQTLVGTATCADSCDCGYAAYGTKACGGPRRFLIFSKSTVDEDLLRRKVAELNAFEDVLNHRYGYYSDCGVEPIPRLGCVDGVCVDLGPEL